MDYEYELRGKVEAEIQPGERVLWAGKPTPMRVALQHLGSVFGGLFMLGFAIVWTLISSEVMVGVRDFEGDAGAFAFFPLLGLLFIGIGLVTTLQPVYHYLMAGRTVYAITDRRALIIQPGLTGTSVHSYPPEEIDAIERKVVNGDMGDLVFRREVYYVRSRGRSHQRTRKIGFWGIPDVRYVEQLMIDTFSPYEKAKRDEGNMDDNKPKRDEFGW